MALKALLEDEAKLRELASRIFTNADDITAGEPMDVSDVQSYLKTLIVNSTLFSEDASFDDAIKKFFEGIGKRDQLNVTVLVPLLKQLINIQLN